MAFNGHSSISSKYLKTYILLEWHVKKKLFLKSHTDTSNESLLLVYECVLTFKVKEMAVDSPLCVDGFLKTQMA